MAFTQVDRTNRMCSYRIAFQELGVPPACSMSLEMGMIQVELNILVGLALTRPRSEPDTKIYYYTISGIHEEQRFEIEIGGSDAHDTETCWA